MENITAPVPHPALDHANYAGFWVRFIAASIDMLLYTPFYMGICAAFGEAHPWLAEAAFAVFALASYAWFFASKWQGSPGMHLLRFYICDTEGRRIGFMHGVGWGVTGTVGWAMCFAGVIYLQTHFDIQGVRDLLKSCQELNIAQADCAAEVERNINIPYESFAQMVLAATGLAVFLSGIWALSIALPKDKTGFHNVLCHTRFVKGRP